jgi:hypothetical protein
LVASTALADNLSDAQRVSASPDVPAIGVGWRGYLFGQAGGVVPVYVPSGPGFAVDIPALIQLTNDRNDPAPNDYWRGLIGLEVAYRRAVTSAGLASLALQLQHESDHETRHTNKDASAPYGFYQLNSVGLQGDLPFDAWGQRVTASLTGRFHYVTCTDTLNCANANGGFASKTVEGIAQLIWDGALSRPERYHVRPVVAVYLDGILANGFARGEQRLVLNAGAWCPTVKDGILELFALAWLGNDVGYLRANTIRQVGVVLRWSP